MIGTTIVFGVLFVVLGIGGFVATGSSKGLALMPAAVGVAYVVLGLVARNERRRMHALHTTALLALLGLAVAGWRSVPKLIGGETKPAVLLMSGMAALSAAYFALCLRSFIMARRRRLAGA